MVGGGATIVVVVGGGRVVVAVYCKDRANDKEHSVRVIHNQINCESYVRTTCICTYWWLVVVPLLL